MKPIILATLEYPPQIGGVAEYLRYLVEEFPRGSIHVLAPNDERAHEFDMRSEAPIYRKSLLTRFFRPRWLPAVYWTDWLRRKEKPGVLIVSHLLPMGMVALILRRLTGLRYVVILHGMDVALASQAGGHKKKSARAILREAETVVANSAYTAGFAESLGVPKNKIVLVRPSPSFPLDTTVTPQAVKQVRDRFGLGNDFIVLTVGRLVARKGHATCLEAVAGLLKRGVSVKYLIVGDGPERATLEKKALELGIAEQVRFAGAVPKDDLPAIFGACDVFVMVPKSLGADVEGFGIVYLEANLLGKPVIGSRSGGVIDAVFDGQNGLLVDPDDAGALEKSLRRLFDDPSLREKLGSYGRERVRDEFGWRRQMAPLLDALSPLIDEKGE